MNALTKKTLIKQLCYIDEDKRICIRCKTPSGDTLYYDLDMLINEQGIILHSEGLDLTIEADTEMIKNEGEIIL